MDCVMDQPVPNGRFMNMAALRVVNKKRKIAPVLVGLVFQIFMEIKNMIFKIHLEFGYVVFACFFFFEFSPSVKQVLQRNNFFKHKNG